MAQERLSGLAILSIENEATSELHYSEILGSFSFRKSRERFCYGERNIYLYLVVCHTADSSRSMLVDTQLSKEEFIKLLQSKNDFLNYDYDLT
jgi:hypothetical protein